MKTWELQPRPEFDGLTSAERPSPRVGSAVTRWKVGDRVMARVFPFDEACAAWAHLTSAQQQGRGVVSVP